MTVLYCTILYCTILHCTVLYWHVLHCTVLHSTVLACAVLQCAVLQCAVLACTILYCTVYCIVLYCTLLHCTFYNGFVLSFYVLCCSIFLTFCSIAQLRFLFYSISQGSGGDWGYSRVSFYLAIFHPAPLLLGRRAHSIFHLIFLRPSYHPGSILKSY